MQSNMTAKGAARGVLIHPSGIYYSRDTKHQWARRAGIPAVAVACSTEPHPFLLRFLGVEDHLHSRPSVDSESEITPEESVWIEEVIDELPQVYLLFFLAADEASRRHMLEPLREAIIERRKKLAASNSNGEHYQTPQKSKRKRERDALRVKCAELAKLQYEQTGQVDWDAIVKIGAVLYPPPYWKHYPAIARKRLRDSVRRIMRKLWDIRLADK